MYGFIFYPKEKTELALMDHLYMYVKSEANLYNIQIC